jgi:transposase InsO family protein
MATDNESWGYTRIVGELSKLQINVSRASVKRILTEFGIKPAPDRLKHMPWSKFLKTHWEGLAAADFFTIEVWTRFVLTRYLVFFVIDLSSRRVVIAGIKPVPDGCWMVQIARNLVDDEDGFLNSKTHLILDRDPLYTAQFRSILMSGGVEVVRLPPRSPNLNAYAERFVLSIKSECLNRMIPLGERHLRKAIDEYVEHYHLERTHQGLDNQLIDGVPETHVGPVHRRERLGGILNSYYREAA